MGPETEYTMMQAIPKKKSTMQPTNSRPPHIVKSNFVCMAKSVMARQTAAVIPTAIKMISVS